MFNFPLNPVLDQIYKPNDVAWKWNGATWDVAESTISFTGDATGTVLSGGSAVNFTLSSSPVAAGTYSNITVDSKGRITAIRALTAQDLAAAAGGSIITTNGGTVAGTMTVNGSLLVNNGVPTAKSVVTKEYIDAKIYLALALGY
jgi:phage-related tail fiber protein